MAFGKPSDVVPGIYRHHSGMLYQVFWTCRNPCTEEFSVICRQVEAAEWCPMPELLNWPMEGPDGFLTPIVNFHVPTARFKLVRRVEPPSLHRE